LNTFKVGSSSAAILAASLLQLRLREVFFINLLPVFSEQ
jgi:hypothetical protein